MENSAEDKGIKQYNDFVLFLKQLEQEINENDKREGKTKRFKLTDVFVSQTDKNSLFHRLMLSKIKMYGKNEEELAPLVKAVHASKIGTCMATKNRENMLQLKIDSNLNPNHSAEMTIYKYLGLYYNRYFRIENGHVVGTNVNLFDYNNPKEVERNFIKNADYIPMILTADGKCYYSVDQHQQLAEWLTASGIDLKRSVRITLSHQLYKMSIASAGRYAYTEDLEGDEDIALTKCETDAVAKIYSICKNKWAKITSVNNLVANSDLFGNGEYRNITENNMKNLKQMEYSFDEIGEDFSVTSYKRFLRDKSQSIFE